MPKALYGHEMVTLEKDLVVIGGNFGSFSHSSFSLYRMTCQNHACEWQTMSQELKIGRRDFVAMLLPDELAYCGKY